MSSFKTIKIELGVSFDLFTVTMSDGEIVKAVRTGAEDGDKWHCESGSFSESLELHTLAVCKAAYNSVLNAIAGDEDGE